MSASSRAAVALILTLLGRSLRAQSAADSGTAGAPKQISRSSDAPRAERTVEKPVIDAARLVRERGVRDLSDLLTDRVPGMLVVPGSGLTDMGSRIRVRGVQTLVGDRAPVVFVDGMRMDQTEDDFAPVSSGVVASGPLRLDDLNPEDIESIEVVEGPASAALYGPGAAAGVLLIHTQRGRPGPPSWEAYAAGGVAAERPSWPANFSGVDRDNPDSLYRTGACSLFAEAAGWCVQDFVQQFNPLEQPAAPAEHPAPPDPVRSERQHGVHLESVLPKQCGHSGPRAPVRSRRGALDASLVAHPAGPRRHGQGRSAGPVGVVLFHRHDTATRGRWPPRDAAPDARVGCVRHARAVRLGPASRHAGSPASAERAERRLARAVQHVPVRHAVGAPAVTGLLFRRKHRPPRARVRDRCGAPRPLRCDRREHHVSERGRVVAGARRGLRLVQSAAATSGVRLCGPGALGVPAPGTWFPSSCWLRVAARAR